MALANWRKPFKRELEHKINNLITAPQVRMVGDNIEPGVFSIREALRMAEEQGLDLVEIAAAADPPVCRIVDYNKFLYDKKKKEKEQKAKQVKNVTKEIRFTPNTDEHDFDFKSRHAENFLKEGAKVKAYVQFRGRTILFKDRGELLLLKFIERLKDAGIAENLPKQEGNRMWVLVNPKPKKS
ncbi:MAG: translation initiation factor IF-3 [Chitinophagales bacterium]|nr:translation initiation factor IF-3 [Chitinophagales bacterium]